LRLSNCAKKEKLVPYAITGNKDQHQPLAAPLALAWVDYKAGKTTKEQSAPVADIVKKTEVICTPIRSGQQIYARDSNLLIMNQVSAGAEVIADGNVHIFGALRGRAIAGAQGNIHAEIICQQMHAELVAIAGTYLVQDDFPEGEGSVRCRLNASKIIIDYL